MNEITSPTIVYNKAKELQGIRSPPGFDGKERKVERGDDEKWGSRGGEAPCLLARLILGGESSTSQVCLALLSHLHHE